MLENVGDREKELVSIIEQASQEVERDLERYRASHESITKTDERVLQELGEVRTFLTTARGNLDKLLTLREQPHIISPDGMILKPEFYMQENNFFSGVVHNSLMALGIRSEIDSEDSSKVSALRSKAHQVEANFTLAESYVAMGICIPDAQKRYETVISYGSEVHKKTEEKIKQGEKDLDIVMMRLAYKIGTSYKRLFDIQYHLLKTIEKEIEVVVDRDRQGILNKLRVEKQGLLYGHIPREGGVGQIGHSYYIQARSWLWKLFDLNQKAKLTNLDQLEFSHYQFMLYMEDVAQLGIGCIFNVLKGDKLECVGGVDERPYHDCCPNENLSQKQMENMVTRARIVLGIKNL